MSDLISELPLINGFYTDMPMYSPQESTKCNSLLFNLIPMDDRIFSRPAFVSQATFTLDSKEEILHTAVENSKIIVVTNQKLRVFSSAYILEHTTTFTSPSLYASGAHYLNTYVVTTEQSGFYVVSAPKNGTLTVTATPSIHAPVPYSTGDKVIGARVISALGNSLYIGNLTITKANPVGMLYEESYIIFSKLSQTAAQLPLLPFKIDDNTFETNYPFMLAAQGALVELEWYSGQLLASFSSGESFLLDITPSILIPVRARKLSNQLGSIGEGGTIVLENNAFVLAQETIAHVQQSGNLNRIGDHIRSFIKNRNDIPTSSAISTSLQSVIWLISSNLSSRSQNQLLCLNYFSQTASLMGIAQPYVIRSIFPKPESRDLLLLVTNNLNQTCSFALIDETQGQDQFDGTKFPITHGICSQTTRELRKGLGTSNLDPHFLTVSISCPTDVVIEASKRAYNGLKKDSDTWEPLSLPIQLERRNKGFVGTSIYACTFPSTQNSNASFISMEIAAQDRFTIEYAAIEQSQTWS